MQDSEPLEPLDQQPVVDDVPEPGGATGSFDPPSLPQLAKIDLGGFKLDVGYYLTKEYEDVNQASAEIPAVIEWLNSLLQDVLWRKINADHGIKRAESQAFFDLSRGGFEDRYPDMKKSQTALVLAARLDPKVISEQAAYASAASWSSRLSSTIAALQAKLDIVRTAEATNRRAYDSERPNT